MFKITSKENNFILTSTCVENNTVVFHSFSFFFSIYPATTIQWKGKYKKYSWSHNEVYSFIDIEHMLLKMLAF